MALSATTSAEPCALVPPRRFGQLLERARVAAGTSIEVLAERSRDLAPYELVEAEMGARALGDSDVARLADLYDIDPGIFRAERSQLIFDLAEGSRCHSRGRRADRHAYESVLDDYLAVVRALRDERAVLMELRADDIAALAHLFDVHPDRVRDDLDLRQRRDHPRLEARSRYLRSRRVVPAAGLLVSDTTRGTLLLVGEGGPGAVTPRTSGNPTSLLLGQLGTWPTTVDTSALVSATHERLAAAGRAALAMIGWAWTEHLPGWVIEFRPTRTGYLGGTMAYEKRIELYVRDGSPTDELAMTIAHELGHAIDVSHLDWDDRASWLRARGLPVDHPWWPGNGMTDYQVGAGDFAEKVAERLVGRVGFDTIGGPLTDTQARLIDHLVPDRTHARIAGVSLHGDAKPRGTTTTSSETTPPRCATTAD